MYRIDTMHEDSVLPELILGYTEFKQGKVEYRRLLDDFKLGLENLNKILI